MKLCQKFMTCWQGFGNHWQCYCTETQSFFYLRRAAWVIIVFVSYYLGPKVLIFYHNATKETLLIPQLLPKMRGWRRKSHHFNWTTFIADVELLNLLSHSWHCQNMSSISIHSSSMSRLFFAQWANRYAAIGISTKTIKIKMEKKMFGPDGQTSQI